MAQVTVINVHVGNNPQGEPPTPWWKKALQAVSALATAERALRFVQDVIEAMDE